MQNNKVLDVTGGRDAEGSNIIVWSKHNGKNQQWKIIYVDTIPEKEEVPVGLVPEKPEEVKGSKPGCIKVIEKCSGV